jgi:hypothetical protein
MEGLQRKERLLRKVKLNSGGGATVKWLDVFYDEPNARYIHHHDERTSDAGVTEDFLAAMRVLREHWCIICELGADPKGNHPFDGSLKGSDKVHVGSVILSGGVSDPKSDEEPSPVGVQIHGTRKLTSGRVFNALAPAIKLGSPQENYKFNAQLDGHIAQIEAEAWAYLEGKVAPPAQTALNFTDADGVVDMGDGDKLLGEAK